MSVATPNIVEGIIELHVDLTVDLAKEQELLHNFQTIFKPAASQQPGYIDVKLLKLRETIYGSAPAEANYRFALRFESEELRQQWIATPTHQAVWPAIENTLSNNNFNVLLYAAV
jgi:heme-degrading monooxygenase HmoA